MIWAFTDCRKIDLSDVITFLPAIQELIVFATLRFRTFSKRFIAKSDFYTRVFLLVLPIFRSTIKNTVDRQVHALIRNSVQRGSEKLFRHLWKSLFWLKNTRSGKSRRNHGNQLHQNKRSQNCRLLICNLSKHELSRRSFLESCSADTLDTTSSVVLWEANR